MSEPINYVDDLLGMMPGATIIVRMNEDGTLTNTWTAVGDGNFTDGDAILQAEGFRQAVERGNVMRPGDHSIGQYIQGTDGYYYRIIGREDQTWVMAKTDGNARVGHTTLVRGEPMGQEWNHGGNPGVLGQAFDMIEKIYAAEQDQARLAKIMETGEVPDEVAYRVTVQVEGHADIRPSEKQVRQMLGDNKITITNVEPGVAYYSKSVLVDKTSRWGCACALVEEADLGDLPGTVTVWRVTECATAEGLAQAHRPPEVAVEVDEGAA